MESRRFLDREQALKGREAQKDVSEVKATLAQLPVAQIFSQKFLDWFAGTTYVARRANEIVAKPTSLGKIISLLLTLHKDHPLHKQLTMIKPTAGFPSQDKEEPGLFVADILDSADFELDEGVSVSYTPMAQRLFDRMHEIYDGGAECKCPDPKVSRSPLTGPVLVCSNPMKLSVEALSEEIWLDDDRHHRPMSALTDWAQRTAGQLFAKGCKIIPATVKDVEALVARVSTHDSSSPRDVRLFGELPAGVMACEHEGAPRGIGVKKDGRGVKAMAYDLQKGSNDLAGVVLLQDLGL